MKKYWVTLLAMILFFSCNNTEKDNSLSSETQIPVSAEEIRNRSFDELFKKITENEIPESVFKLVGEDFTVLTSGNENDFNSMVASWGGWGILFNKPTTWCFLRANRYTLDYIKREHTYTMAYFDDSYKEQIMAFGTQSGRNTGKMKETSLSPVVTPSGSVSFKEAKLIIECRLTEMTTVKPEDFYSQEGKEFITEAYQEANEYHKILFGEITGVWIRE